LCDTKKVAVLTVVATTIAIKQFFEGNGVAILNANIVKYVTKPKDPKLGAE